MNFKVRLPVPPHGAGPPAASATTRPFVRGLPTTVPRGVVQDIWSQSGYGERRCRRRASAKQQQTNGKRVAPWSRVTPAICIMIIYLKFGIFGRRSGQKKSFSKASALRELTELGEQGRLGIFRIKRHPSFSEAKGRAPSPSSSSDYRRAR